MPKRTCFFLDMTNIYRAEEVPIWRPRCKCWPVGWLAGLAVPKHGSFVLEPAFQSPDGVTRSTLIVGIDHTSLAVGGPCALTCQSDPPETAFGRIRCRRSGEAKARFIIHVCPYSPSGELTRDKKGTAESRNGTPRNTTALSLMFCPGDEASFN